MTPAEQHNQNINDLLADRAVFGLNVAEEAELASLLGDAAENVSDDEAVASLLMLSDIEEISPLPSSLAARIHSDAVLKQSPVSESALSQMNVEAAPSRPLGLVGAIGWLVAACLFVVAGFGWLRDTSEAVVPSPTVAEMRRELLKTAGDAITVAWLPSEDPAAKTASGDVVWSEEQQTGFMRITGLDVNDPSDQQYQLWIIDGERDAAKPVDGGVFDIPTDTGEVIIPIDAKLMVYDARAFAITIEKPGGVVVSDRERLPLLASVGG